MYEIFLFSGGVYRFDELKELVEDIGGLVLKKNLFHLSRGSSFLSSEVEVMLIIPVDDEDNIKALSDEIKGHLERIDVEDLKKKDIMTYISICDALAKSGEWLTLDEIKDLIECPCPVQLCKDQDQEVCVHDQMDKSIEKFCVNDILKSRKKKKTEYTIKEV